LRRKKGGLARFLTSVAELWVRGVQVTWPAPGRVVDLPTYAFQRERYWLESGVPAAPAPPTRVLAGGGRTS